MTDQILLYISAASDLRAEREILGRTVTEIPTTLGWRIVQSPIGDDPVDLIAVARADVHLLLIGGDIRAPIGLEWATARNAGRHPVLFLKQNTMQTPAAQKFIHFVRTQSEWTPYTHGADLRHKVLKILTDHILERALSYALSPVELERLRIWRAELETAAVNEELYGGAGDSSIILSKERFVPSEGVLIKPGESNVENI